MKDRELDFIASLVTELVCWYETQGDNNPLWYASQTMEARLLESPGVATPISRSKVPLDQVPARLVPIERAITRMRDVAPVIHKALVHKHLGDQKSYKKATGCGKSVFYSRVDQAYGFIAGMYHGVS